MSKILVKTKTKTYPVFIGNKSLNQIDKFISSDSKVLILIDKNVKEKCSQLVEKIENTFSDKNILIINCTEKNKSIKTVEKICKYLSDNFYNRQSTIVSIGGGILGDLAGFVASIYMRGIKLIQIATTILSAVDSSVGGKTGVNFHNKKNLIGTFYQPEAVFINSEFFSTLHKREIISGIGELVKYALIIPDLYDFFLREIKQVLFKKEVSDKLIQTSISIKAEFIKADEKEETGLRKILNLGHTFAHGFESATNFRISHGQAVFSGIICALMVSERKCLMQGNVLKKFLKDFSFIPNNKILKQIDTNSVLNFMRSDKKNSQGEINLVLPSKDGIVINFPVEENVLIKTINSFKRMI